MKVLLVDAFPMVRAALTSLVESRFGGAQVTGVGSVADARTALAASLPELVLLDLHIDGGPAFLRDLHREHLLLKVVVISGSDDAAAARAALAAGAVGYVPERSDLETLVSALHLVMAGGIFVPPLKDDGKASPVVATAPRKPEVLMPGLALTPRQRQVLPLLAAGQQNKEIARELHLSVDTVKDHVAAILRALGATSRVQAVAMLQKSDGH
ncbi:LuxR C-terminal-related transcriptional regulator [Roseateles sp.]|uniref:LuxR C-terminal-related transcriptional regulator n=1 Tax=Roseateles sp. TaxID=1971397 RepID=UPI003958DD37